jgi:uncharacterized RDD family membrane protein YckC
MATELGVYFRSDDYASFWRRLLVDLIDGTVILAAWLLTFATLANLDSAALIFVVCGAFCFGYLVLLKRTERGTLGYRACGVRIVGIDGCRAGIAPLTIRALFVLFGPINYLWDALWISTDTHRQALRDKFADTYVVKRKAEPVGSCRLIHCWYWIFNYNFLFRELESPIR